MLILASFYFALPIFLANMAPVLFIWVPLGAQPLDGGRRWHGQPIFGPHKTWRGVVAAVVVAVFVILLQSLAEGSWPELRSISVIDYQASGLWRLGFSMGFGAIAGDAIKSFFKRRLGKKSGAAWPPFDQLDFMIGGLLGAFLFVHVPLFVVLILLLITPFLHWLTNVVAYRLHLKDVPW